MRLFALILCTQVLIGCRKAEGPEAKVVQRNAEVEITRAQPILPALQIHMGAASIKAEVARSVTEVKTGMMFRTNLTESDGMLFVFPYPQKVGFWMKNTTVPLSCAYINAEGRIEEIHQLEPLSTQSVMSASGNIQFALETSQGWFERNAVKTGMVVRSENGDLRKMVYNAR
jgi:uncharacterized membrane protein (UPF0127 family)